MAAQWTVPDGLRTTPPRLPVEGVVPSFAGAPADLRGNVALVSFWTYTCVNWLRQLPYLRAWAHKYADHGLVVLGVHTPEFGFEAEPDNVSRAVAALGVDYPVVADDDYAIWRAFGNSAWPALYLADTEGRIRRHHLGEGEYQQTEAAIQALLTERGSTGFDPAPVTVAAEGIEAPADWTTLRTAETYTGYQRTAYFASPGGLVPNRRHAYAEPARLAVDAWALAGDWTAQPQAVMSDAPGGRIAYRFHARDLHLVLAPAMPGSSVPFRVRLDGGAPGPAHGLDVDADGYGVLAEPRLYQLIRQPGEITDRTFDITFGDAGAGAYAFTFG
ncbi:thiol-disulfide isomerase/thioredoxin [Hamadaea flava]|uniref:Redoxin family protein n=1 Tax=Hamadaea flava TaxID=1742688 RepID=A0ABV8LX93_9ACTN|nr:redoxin family protein [Hamadaea flava]MCP2329129.1 thiol-disulfide isomerase/thioredoxin [Hamadaea flava]